MAADFSEIRFKRGREAELKVFEIFKNYIIENNLRDKYDVLDQTLELQNQYPNFTSKQMELGERDGDIIVLNLIKNFKTGFEVTRMSDGKTWISISHHNANNIKTKFSYWVIVSSDLSEMWIVSSNMMEKCSRWHKERYGDTRFFKFYPHTFSNKQPIQIFLPTFLIP